MSSSKTALYLFAGIVAFFLVFTVTQKRFEQYRAQMVYQPQFASLADRERQLDCLAKNIYHEAAFEPFEGKVAVAQVTLNRVESGKFAKDICGVVYQKNVIYQKVICQFSWFCETKHKTRPINELSYNESYEVAKKVLLENFRLDGLKTALYYHADYVNPRWKLDKLTQIGRHIFYTERANVQ